MGAETMFLGIIKVYRNKRHTAYKLSKNLVVIKYHRKMEFWCKEKGLINYKFSINPHRQWRYFHWLIRLPFFYWQRHNVGVEIGVPGLYLWFIKI